MLPAAHRLTRAADFGSTVRDGRRVRVGSVIVYQYRDAQADPPRVGFVVSRAVGGSVVRHRVARRLRAQMTCRLSRLPGGSRTVVRALPGSARASSAQVGADLDRALERYGAA